MNLNTLISWLLCLLLSFPGIAQDKNPFQSIGKTGKILTLSNGKYEELFDQDSIQQIGTALINTRTMKVFKLLKDEKEAQRLLDNSTNSRFLSVDPLAYSFAMLTPYQYASNSPIANIDLDGREAYWYKIYLDETTNKWTAKLEAIKTNWFLEITPGYQLVVKVGEGDWINAGGWSKAQLQNKVNEFVTDPIGSMNKLLKENAELREYADQQRQEWEDIWVQGFTIGVLGKNYKSKSTPNSATNKQVTAALESEEAAKANTAGTEQLNLQQRAKEIHSKQTVVGQRRTTTAVGVGTTATGESVTLVSSSNARLTPAQRVALKSGEIPISNKELGAKSNVKIHAELKITLYANINNIKLDAVAPIRPACPSCVIAIKESGALLEGKIKGQ